MSIETIEKQAKFLAAENKKAEPEIQKVFWFPDEQEVRLVELTPSIPPSSDGRVHAFYFRSDPDGDLPAPSGIAMIRPIEFGELRLPDTWGGWGNAVELEVLEAEDSK